MDKRIGLKKGSIINYLGVKHEVTSVYPYIAYIRNMTTNVEFCVGIGDLVIAGVDLNGVVRNPVVKKGSLTRPRTK